MPREETLKGDEDTVFRNTKTSREEWARRAGQNRGGAAREQKWGSQRRRVPPGTTNANDGQAGR